MLQIKINNEFLDLGEFSVTFELLNPIFNDVGSFSYPFTLPASPGNLKKLNFPGRLHSNLISNHSTDVSLYLNGLMWKRAKLIVREVDDKKIKVNLGVGEGYFYNTIKDLKLTDIDLGGNRQTSDYLNPNQFTIFDNVYDKNFPEVDFTIFPFSAPNFHSKKSFYNTWLNQTNGIINRWNTNQPEPVGYFTGGLSTFVTFPFLNYILRQIALQTNISISDNTFYSDPFLRQLVLFKLFSINENIGNQQLGDVLRTSPTFNLAHGLPEISLSDFLQKLKMFNAHVFFDDQKNSLNLLLFKDIYNSDPEVFDSLPYRQNLINPIEYDGFEMKYDLDSSDDFIEDHFKEISQFNYKGSIPTFFELPPTSEENDLYFIEAVRAYYYWIAPRTYGSNTYFGEWVYFSNDRLGFSEGTGKLNISIPGVFSRPQNAFIPYAGNEGEIYTLSERFFKPKAADFRLLFWYGLDGSGIPNGGAFNTNACPYSLEWSGEHGIKEKFYKEWLQFQATTRETEFGIPFTPAQLKLIDFGKKYRFAQANWLFDKIRFTVTNRRISPATVTAWKV